jgi:hypothetical protein
VGSWLFVEPSYFVGYTKIFIVNTRGATERRNGASVVSAVVE